MSPIYVPGKVVLAKEFTQQSYMWEFPAQYGLWSPANITTALWLDAADSSTVTTVSGAVSQWNDKSGNANHATQSTSGSRPTRQAAVQNGLGALLFDGTDDWLSGATTPCTSNAKTIISVARNSISTGGTVYINRQGSGLKFLTRQFFPASTSFVGGDATTNNVTIATDLSTAWQSFTISSWTQQSSNRAVFYWNNGTSYATTGIPLTEAGTAGYRVGTALDGNGDLLQPYPGNICELVVLNLEASTNTRQKTEGYLAHKWGLTANLPNDHPYKTVGPTP
jgi:hypothetical protein